MNRRSDRKFLTLSLVALFVTTLTVLFARTGLSQVKTGEASRQPSAPEQVNMPGFVSASPAPLRTGSTQAGSMKLGGNEKFGASTLGSGDSLFLAAVTYGSGAENANSVVVADVNGDGRVDLVVSNCDPSGSGGCGFVRNGVVGVLLGNGDGTFQPAAIYDSGGNLASSVAVADVDGDSKPDIIVTHVCATTGCEKNAGVSVLLGNGDGTFKKAVTYNSGELQSSAVAVADVNGDGKNDILVTNCVGGISCGNEEGTVSVLLGNGDGTFQAPVVYGSGDVGPMSVAAVDIDGDGRIDLLVANCGCADGGFWTSGSVSVLLGNGDGTFQAAVTYPTGPSPWSVVVADVNGDHKPDVLVANSCWCGHDASVAVLLGNGDGTLQPAVTYDSGGIDSFSIAVGDVNGDGKLDLLVTSISGTVGVLLGNGDGTFQANEIFGAGTGGAQSIVIADLNGDGWPDVVVADETEPGLVSVLLNDASGSIIPSTTTLMSSLNPSDYGQTVTFTATVSSSSETPTGTVIFYDGSIAVGSVTLSKGSASLSTSSLSVDSHSITASYQGSDTFAPSKSAVLDQVVNGIATATSLASSLNPSLSGQSVTFAVTITSASGTPTGTVIFYNGSSVLGSVTLASGSGSLSTSSLSAGSHLITATYQGSGAFASSTSAVLDQVVNGKGVFSTTTKLSTSGSPSSAGQSVTFTATVISINGSIPNGETVTFYDGSTELGTGITAGGAATFTTSSLAPGKHTIEATYSGDATFKGSNGTIAQVVGKYASTTTLAGNPNPAAYGQAVTYTATVTSSGPNTPTGDVRFTGVGVAPLVGGVATYTKKGITAGTHAVTAEYEGDSNSAPSTSPVLEEVVNPASTTTVITSADNPSSSGVNVTFTATVTSSTGLAPFGTVTFTAGSATLGKVVVTDTVASISTTTLPVGSTKITATYSGAAGFRSSSAFLTQKVNP
jgi:hypothetical protein